MKEMLAKLQPKVENKKYNTVIDHTRMEKLLFNEKKNIIDTQYQGMDYTIDEIEKLGNEKLNTFEYLSQDLFNMMYKLAPSMRDDADMEGNIARFNKKIVEKVKDNPEYQALKVITEGNDFESIEGTREFIKTLYDNLDNLLKDMTGNKEILNQLDKTEKIKQQKEQQLETAIEMYQQGQQDGLDEATMQELAKKVKSLKNQVDGIERKKKAYEDAITAESYKNDKEIDKNINAAVKAALDKVHNIQDTLDSWGTEDGRPQTIEGKTSLLKKINSSGKFKEMANYIGKMRRLLKSELNKSYEQGMGEKVGIEFGDKVNKILPAEYVLLALPETKPLFYKKFIEKKLKQYKERTTKYEGMGNIIVCNDESGSTAGGKEYWSKALSIALLDVSRKEHRNYAYIPFSSNIGQVVEVTAENYTEDTMLQIANSFMGGGTNFDEPLSKAIELLDKDQYQKADLVFITDGESDVMPETVKKLEELKKKKGTKCVGILLDKGGSKYVTDQTLKLFADKIYKTSELSEDTIAQEVLRGTI